MDARNLGLNLVAEIEYSDASYVFDTRIVYADAEGTLYTARDSGCSCPTPFEDFRKIEDFERFDLATILNEVDNAWDDRSDTNLAGKLDFIAKIKDAATNPVKYAFDQLAYEREQEEYKVKAAISDGLREAARFLGLQPYALKVHELVPLVQGTGDLDVAQVHVLGTYLANIAGQQRDALPE